MKKTLNWICIFIIYFFSAPVVSYSEIDRLALPQGGNVVSGNVNINYAALDRLNVNQSSNQAIVNWQSFNVGKDASVHFNQPGSKASILNNVLSGRSIINGSIYSNGRLFLVNPTGILTGPHSAIKAEGAVLSSLNLSKQNYLNNNYQFNTNSNSSLVNQGLIEGQYVALIAPQVNNKGTIITSAATTIAAGDDVLLGISDSNNLTVKVSPSKLQAMAKNEGTIKTQNGIVTIKTDAAQSLVDGVVKLPNAKADGLVSENGVIKLVSNSGSIKAKKIKIDAGSKGAAEISGNLNSSNENGKGGTIEITAKDIDVNAAKISADGNTGGGKVLIGGDWQGSGDLLQATYVNVDDATIISANASTSGAGGKIVLWSDIKDKNSITTVNGSLFAKGIDGDGGKIETSGSVINTDRIIVNASSKLSRGGLWLIDPYDYTIDATAVSNITSALNSGTSVTVATSADNSNYGSGGSSSGNGDITITSNLQTTADSSTSATLTLTAARHITLNNGVSITDINSHSLSVAMNAGGDITLQGDIDVAGTVALTTTSYSGGSGGSPTTVNFSYAGSAVSWTVPSGVSSLTIDAKGAGGGYGYSDPTYPGKGGRLQATFSATAGESLRIRVGGRGENSTQNPGGGAAGKYVRGSAQGGFNGGGNASGTHYSAGGGGGATDIRRGGDALSNRIAVAGGGGGQGAQRRGSAGGGGNGHGGGTTGASGSNGGYNHATGGGGGTQSAGGARGTGNQNNGTAGSLGQGGAGGGSGREGGGGGGGYYGGGGGGSSPSGGGGGGGGGSNYILSGASSVTHTRGGGGTYNAHGSLSITYTASSTEYGDIVINGDLKAGAGVASNSNRGSTVSTEGDLTIAGDASIKDGITADSITNNGIMRWTVNAGNLTTSHQISGSGKLFKYGSSNLTLSNSQSYTGDTEIYSGTLINNSTLSDSTDLILTGGNYTANATDTVASISTSNSSSTLTIASSQILTTSTSSDTTFAGIIAGSGGFKKAGSGTLTLSGTNTYTGGTDITAGGILITNDRNLGAVPGSADADNVIIRNGATLATGNTNVTMAANRGFNVPSGTAKLLKYTRKSWTLNNPISGSGGVNFDDSTASGGNGGGGGRYYLKVANTYTGDTLISFRGTRDPGVVVDHNNAFQNTTVDFNNTNIPNANETSEPLLWFRTTAPVLGGLKGDRDLINEQSFTANAVLNIGNNNEDTTFSGRIRDGQRTYGIKKIGTGSLTLTGSNSYSGGTTLAGGSISGYSGDLSLAPTSAITLSSNLSSPSLSGSANINLSSYTLTIGSDNTSTSYTGVISGTGGMVKQGSGTLTLTGTQTYTGDTTISAGTLTVSGSGSLNSGNYAGAIANSGTLNYASSTSQTLSGVISGTGSVTKSGSSTLTLSGNNTYSGDTTISAGTINVSGKIGNGSYSGAIANSGTFIMSSSTAHTLSGAISGSGGITKSGSGNLTLSGSNNFTGTITLSNGTLIGASDNALGSAPTIAASNSPTFQTSSGSITLPSLTVTGEINLTSDIITTGAQSYSAATTIGASSGSAITVRTTNSNITFSDDVKLYQNTAINSGSGGGTITFGGDMYTHNSASAERNLVVNAGTGDVTFSGSITGGGDYSPGFTEGNFTQKSDLDFSGTFLNAANISGTATTIDDVTFKKARASDGNHSNMTFVFQNEIGSWNSVLNYGDSGLNNLMKGIRWSGWNNSAPTVTFTNATAGKKYKIQALFKERCCNRYFDVYVDGTKIKDDFKPRNAGNDNSASARYLTYQFQAASSNIQFRLSGRTGETSGSKLHGNDANPILNAISVEEVNAGKKINNLTVSGAAVSAAGIEVTGNMSITNSGTSSVTGVVAGSGDFTKAGSGMLSLTGANTYSGDTTVSAGTLRLSGTGTLGSGSYSGAITNNGIFRYSSSSAQTLSGVISGTGRVDANSSSAALTLTGTNTYTGGTRIAGGSIVAGSARALGATPTINATSTSSQLTVSSGLTLPSLTVTGSAIRLNSGVTTTGAQSYAGDVLIASGTRASPVTFGTTNSNISFKKTLKGQGNAKARSLTINAGTGNVLFGDRVGYAFNNQTFDANNTADSFYKMTVTAGTTSIKGDVMTYEEQTYNSNIDIGSTGSNGLTRTLLSMDPKVIINGNINDTVANRHTLVAKAVAIRREGQTPGTPDVSYNGTIGQTKKLAGYSGATGYQVVASNYGTIDTSENFGAVTGGTQTNGKIGGSGSGNGSQSNKRRAQKSANAVAKSAKTTIADAGKNLIATLFGGGPSGGGRTFSKSIEVVMPGDSGFNQPGPETGSGANIDADFSSPGNNQSSPSFEPRGNNSISGAPKTNAQGGNFSSTNRGSGSSKPRSIKELFSSRDFKNQFGSRKEMRQFKREFRQNLRQNPGSRKSFNKALRQGMDPTDPKAFENASPEQRKAFDEFRKRATPEEQKAFRKLKNGEEDPRKSIDKSKEKMDGKSKDNKKLEDDDEQKKKNRNAKAN